MGTRRPQANTAQSADSVVVSLCSGVGGLDIGTGHMPVVVSESDQGCAALLEKRFPAAVNVGDWTQIDYVGDLPCAEPGLITAGLPCQPVSSSGSRGGDMDARWLFDDLAQLLFRSDERPLLFLENVPALLSRPFRRAFSRWCYTMSQMGYRITQTRVAAAEVGAPHRRQRWFALAAHPDSVSASKMLSAGSSTCTSMSTSGCLLPTPTAADAVRGADSAGVRSAQRNLGNALLPTPLASDARGVPQSIRLPRCASRRPSVRSICQHRRSRRTYPPTWMEEIPGSGGCMVVADRTMPA